jgi:hypothetical protein
MIGAQDVVLKLLELGRQYEERALSIEAMSGTGVAETPVLDFTKAAFGKEVLNKSIRGKCHQQREEK